MEFIASHPKISDIHKSTFITYRRLWLDHFLEKFSGEMHGCVIDLGGKRGNKRGTFRPPVEKCDNWWYINLDLGTSPDVYADVIAIPLPNNSADTIICTEVLEHLPDPQACVREIERILSVGGSAFISVPFMYPVHADPFDFQRFTPDGLRNLFSSGSNIEIWAMGGFWGVLGMFLEIGIPGIEGNGIYKKILRRSLTWIARRLCIYDLNLISIQPDIWQKFTNGYFMRVTK